MLNNNIATYFIQRDGNYKQVAELIENIVFSYKHAINKVCEQKAAEVAIGSHTMKLLKSVPSDEHYDRLANALKRFVKECDTDRKGFTISLIKPLMEYLTGNKWQSKILTMFFDNGYPEGDTYDTMEGLIVWYNADICEPTKAEFIRCDY